MVSGACSRKDSSTWPATRLIAKLRGPGAPTKKELEAIEKTRGYYVLELAPPCDGLPLYSNAGLYTDLERTSFRGAFLHDCEEVIGTELLESAHERCIYWGQRGHWLDVWF